jgi:hypothetical protein
MAATIYIDGTDVTGYAITGSATRRLNRPSQATVTLPIQQAIGNVGSRLKILFNGTLFHHGMIQMIEDSADEDTGYTVYNSSDPMEILQWRPVRDGDDSPTPGNFIDPSVLARKKTGPAILQEVLQASINAGTGPPTDAEGPLFMALGGFAGGGTDLSGAPCTWPITIAELISTLTSTGELDVILTPIDSGGNMASLSAYNGNYGTNRTGSVIFQFATGARNVRSIRQSVDLANTCNKLQYFGGKIDIERFHWNITGSDPCLNDPTYKYSIGSILSRRASSQGSYGVRMEIQQFDVDVPFNEKDYGGGGPPFPNFCAGGDYTQQDPTRILFRKQWMTESWIRGIPRTLVHVTPTRETQIGGFDIGDTVSVQAGSEFRGGFSGAQRVYEYTISWDNDGVLALGEIQTSADQE